MPVELEKMIESRATIFKSARIVWSYQYASRDNGRVIERFQSEYAENGDVALTALPLEREFENPQQAKAPFRWSERRQVSQANGDQWQYVEFSPGAGLTHPGSEYPMAFEDIRTLAQTPTFSRNTTRESLDPFQHLETALTLDGAEIQHYDVRIVDDDHIRVTANMNTGRVFEWDVDPARNWAPLRAALYNADGSLESEMVTDYAIVDDRWFPSSAELRRPDQPIRIIEVEYAEFDKPWHAAGISVADALGMIPGTNIGSRYAFDGEAAVATDDPRYKRIDWMRFYHWLKEECGPCPGCELKRDEKGYYNDPRTAREPKLWENYTRSFIAANKLDAKQTKAAWEVLQDCRRRAYEYLDKIKDNLKDLREDRAKARAVISSEFGDSQSAERAKQELLELDDREERLMDKVESIFNDLLRPGLFKLLTAEQIKAEAARNFAKVKPETLTAEAAEKIKR